jgi:hypothetical protein
MLRALLFNACRGKRFLKFFSPVGKIALTCYLSHTFISIIIFYGLGFNLTGRFELNRNDNRRFGWSPTSKNKSSLFGYFLNVMKKKEKYEDEQGRIRTRWGFEKIKDIRLLEEMIKFKFGGNHDGITAAMSAYFYDYFLQVTYGAPKPPLTQEEERIKREKIKNNRLARASRQKNPYPNTNRAGKYW